jgi:glucosamine-6-phosphate deaminase
VSGANAVSDEALWSKLRFTCDSGLTDDAKAQAARAWCATYENTGALPAAPELQRWKALIRRQEATSAARICGIPVAQLKFLDLPFYETATVKRRRLAEADVAIMQRLLNEVRPHLIYAAGDLDDPHGTHRLCLHALREALARSTKESWFAEAELWLYRGAWAQWELDEIDLAVPLSPQEVLRRRRAIFRHETQKEQSLFLGANQPDFWQGTEERSRHLAASYNALGLAEYEAIEAFKRYAPDEFLRHVQL